LAVKIRLRRMGKKKHPFYRIVATDSRAARDGRFIEMVGTYDPVATPHIVNYKEDRILYWLSVGAQPTDTVRSLFRGKGLWLKWTLIKQGADEAKIAAELENWQNAQDEKAKRAEAQKVQAAKETENAKAKTASETKKAEEAEAKAKAEQAEAEAKVEEATAKADDTTADNVAENAEEKASDE